MLDLLFLLGDPRRSTTLLDEPFTESKFNVGESIYTGLTEDSGSKKNRQDFPET